MPDGRRKRRHSPNATKSRWYAFSRSVRFCRRMSQHELADLSDAARARDLFCAWRRETGRP